MSSLPFRVLSINHMGLAPKDPQKARGFLGDMLGLKHLGDEHVVDQKVETMMFATGEDESHSRMEILAPKPEGEGPIGAFLSKKGSGIHHVALTVSDLNAALKYLDDQGVELIDKEPRGGAHNTQIAFIHPRATGGLLIELVQG